MTASLAKPLPKESKSPGNVSTAKFPQLLMCGFAFKRHPVLSAPGAQSEPGQTNPAGKGQGREVQQVPRRRQFEEIVRVIDNRRAFNSVCFS
jgi:hypothetical protein